MQKFWLTPADDLQKILDSIVQPTTIYLASGIYRQKLKIKCSDVKIIGADRETTVIAWDDYARKIHADGQEYNTFRTYTVCVTGENVIMQNLTVENSNTEPKKVGQCVALSVNAKRFTAQNVALKSTQDTLFLAPFPDDLVIRYRGFIPEDELYMQGDGLHIFKNCAISGTVDFIFGCAEAYFIDCDIISLEEERGIGYIAAPAHSLKQETGFVFVNCNLISRGAKDYSTFLARPWRDFGMCAFIGCTADKHVYPDVFDKWNDTERDKTARFYYGNMTFSTPVAPAEWSKQLTDEEIEDYLAFCDFVEAYVDGEEKRIGYGSK